MTIPGRDDPAVVVRDSRRMAVGGGRDDPAVVVRVSHPMTESKLERKIQPPTSLRYEGQVRRKKSKWAEGGASALPDIGRCDYELCSHSNSRFGNDRNPPSKEVSL